MGSTNQVGVQTSTADITDRLLGRLCLLLVVDDWDHGHMNLEEIVLSNSRSELAKSLDEGSIFNVANSSAAIVRSALLRPEEGGGRRTVQ